MKQTCIVLLLLLGFFRSYSQEINQKIERDFLIYTNYILERQTDKALEYLNPSIYEIIPKAQLKTFMEAIYNNPDFVFKPGVPKINTFSELKFIQGVNYVNFDYHSPLEMKFLQMEFDELKLESLIKTLEGTFGVGNVKYSKETGFFKIDAYKKAIASSNDKENWKFIVIDNEKMKTTLEKIIPAELFE